MQTSKISRQISPLSNDRPRQEATTYDRLSQTQGGIVFAGQVLTDPHRRVRRGPRTFEERVIDARHPRLDAAQKDDDDKEAIRRGLAVLEGTGQINRRMAANVREWLEA